MSDPSNLIGVTGANGFIGAHIVRALLERGYRVRGTVRSLADPKRTAHLTALPGAAERLELVEADLLDTDAFGRFAEGCEAVLHTASPYIIATKHPQADLVDPAVNGTLNVLRACAQAPSVRRVVLTSSFAAVTDEPEDAHVYTEADWNERSSLDRNPYYFSKVRAEKAAWAFMEKEAPGFDLVVINPSAVIGPSLSPGVNTTNRIIADLLRGGVYPGILDFAWSFVDVRDVALAHVLALETPGASGRYLCAAETLSMRELVEVLRGLGAGTLPTRRLDNAIGTFLVKLMSYAQPKGLDSYVRTQIGHTPHVDATKLRTDLGLTFRDVRASILDTAEDLRRQGHV